MKINADFDQRVVVHSEKMEWLDSPMPGVSRRPLDRVGTEVARATSIVRYAPKSKFSPHIHTGGEEFIVLDGVFQDESGDFPVGSYVRNPPESKHQPSSDLGCIIFVKLWQFDPKDRIHVRLNSRFMKAVPDKKLSGISVTSLYKDDVEEVANFDFEPYASLHMMAKDGAEIFVLSGELTECSDMLVKHSWLRMPVGGMLDIKAGAAGAKIWIKQGHLRRVDSEIYRVQSFQSPIYQP
jgi:quercetin dioxygenase-like cupin family protein